MFMSALSLRIIIRKLMLSIVSENRHLVMCAYVWLVRMKAKHKVCKYWWSGEAFVHSAYESWRKIVTIKLCYMHIYWNGEISTVIYRISCIEYIMSMFIFDGISVCLFNISWNTVFHQLAEEIPRFHGIQNWRSTFLGYFSTENKLYSMVNSVTLLACYYSFRSMWTLLDGNECALKNVQSLNLFNYRPLMNALKQKRAI